MNNEILQTVKNFIDGGINGYSVRIKLLAFEDEDDYTEFPSRVAFVPMSEIMNDSTEETKESLLNGAFKYGQNDFDAQQIRSVSVGDIIEITNPNTLLASGTNKNNTLYYVVSAFGFNEMTHDEAFMFASESNHDRFMKSFKK
jgi:hypothetical protein